MAAVQVETLWRDSLNNRGFLAQPQVELEILDKNLARVAQMTTVAARIGCLLAPRHNQGEFLTESIELGLTNEDVRMAHPDAVVAGLYQEIIYPRRKRIDPLVFIHKGRTELTLPGVQPWSVGVRFHFEDFRRLAHSAEAVGSFAAATTLGANQIKANSDDRAERDHKARSAVAHTMWKKTEAINEYEEVVRYEHDTLEIFERSLRDSPPIFYRPETAQKLLLTTDRILRKIIETSSIGRRLTPEQAEKTLLAFTFNFYQRAADQSDDKGIKLAYTAMGKGYLNAVRGKLDESRNACLRQFELHKVFMKPEDREEAEAYLYEDFLQETPPQS